MADVEALRRRLSGQGGQTVSEYSLLLGLITLATIGAIAMLARSEIDAITRVADIFR